MKIYRMITSGAVPSGAPAPFTAAGCVCCRAGHAKVSRW
jgi:hypothetical protein